MNRLIFALSIFLMVSSCQQQEKIAFIDNGKVVNEYYKKKNFELKFQAKIDGFNKKADSLQQAIQVEAQLWQSRATKMNQSKAEEEYQALVQKKQMQDFQLSNEEKELQKEGQQNLDTIVKEVKAFVKDYGKSNGYTFIFGANEAGSVMYGAEANDITEAVLEQLNGKAETEKE
ncbi:OmpH family outer membrane protein [Winogradskyella sp. DF17]|jgi:outer membrane protein|uniref:OmpH family outer membrane protein n=1 Tax=Winogradskyella pelagia TaxID=2819984 RepID=A0ABS3SXN1_9FLAO|nr:OmpH family outer membrane protein [Winogradskyella sp. DF17]MBO3115246.1 OmpH family outer membrane protein [Winogradskyella sp. DF17]